MKINQCSSCGGFCKKSGCERKNVEILAQEQEPVATIAVRWHEPVGKVAYVLEVNLPLGIHKLYITPQQRT